MEFASAALDNLRAPMVLFFALGLGAALVRSDLSMPESVSKALSLYLMMAIGFKGGVALATQGVGWQAASTLASGIAVGLAIPLLAFALLRRVHGLAIADAAAVSAHYGSISVVTFVTATEFLELQGAAYQGYMVAVMAAMETPAIVCGLWLARRFAGRGDVPDRPRRPGIDRQLAREVFLNGSVVLLLGSMIVGSVTGTKGAAAVAPLFDELFRGALCLFLLDMGLVAGRRLRESRGVSLGICTFGLYMPLLGAAIGLGLASAMGLPAGTGALFATLCASASYIAVPAALRLALPQANPAIYVTLSLAVTFPFNVVAGIPLYYAGAALLLGR